jgi:WD40 repeat protein
MLNITLTPNDAVRRAAELPPSLARIGPIALLFLPLVFSGGVMALSSSPADVPRPPKPELVVQVGHAEEVGSIAYSPDGRTLATTGEDNTIRLWAARTGELIRVLDRDGGSIESLAFSRRGDLLVSGGEHRLNDRGDLVLWNTRSGRILRTLPGHLDRVMSVALSSDGAVLASGSYDDTVKIWSVKTGALLRTLAARGAVYEVAFTPDGTRVAAARADAVLLWNVRSGALVKTIGGHRYNVTPIAFSPDGNILAIGGGQEEAKLCDLKTGKTWALFSGEDTVRSIAFSKEGARLACGGYFREGGDGMIRMLDAGTRRTLWRVRRNGSSVMSIAFAPDGKTLACGAGSFADLRAGEVSLLSAETGALKMALAPPGRPVQGVTFGAKGTLLAAALEPGVVSFWDLRSGVLQKSQTFGPRSLSSISLSSDWTKMAANNFGSVRVWNLQSSRELHRVSENRGWEETGVVSPDGSTLAMGYRVPHGTIFPPPPRVDRVSLIDLRTGQLMKPLLIGTPGFASSAVFSPDGRTVATWGIDGVIELWDPQRAVKRGMVKVSGAPLVDVVFAPDTSLFAALIGRTGFVGAHSIEVWDAETQKLKRDFSVPDISLAKCVLSPGANTVVGMSDEGDIELFDTMTGRTTGRFKVPVWRTRSIAIAADGRRLAVAGADGTVTFWDAPARRLLATLRVFPSKNAQDLPVQWIAYTPDGYYNASPGVGRFIRWRVGAKLLPAETYARSYHRPERVRQAVLGREIH